VGGKARNGLGTPSHALFGRSCLVPLSWLARPRLARPLLPRPRLARPRLARPGLARPRLARPRLAAASRSWPWCGFVSRSSPWLARLAVAGRGWPRGGRSWPRLVGFGWASRTGLHPTTSAIPLPGSSPLGETVGKKGALRLRSPGARGARRARIRRALFERHRLPSTSLTCQVTLS